MESEKVVTPFQNLMFGSKKKLTAKQKRIVKQNPYGDYDSDGVINIADCNPTNPKQHGLWSSIKSVGAKVVSAFSPKPKPSEKISLVPTQPTGSTKVQIINRETGEVVYRAGGGNVFVPQPEPSPFIDNDGGGGGGGGGGGAGGGGGGYSYIEPTTGKGYEVSPEGIVKEVIPVTAITTPKEEDKLGLGTSIVSTYEPPVRKVEEDVYKQELAKALKSGKQVVYTKKGAIVRSGRAPAIEYQIKTLTEEEEIQKTKERIADVIKKGGKISYTPEGVIVTKAGYPAEVYERMDRDYKEQLAKVLYEGGKVYYTPSGTIVEEKRQETLGGAFGLELGMVGALGKTTEAKKLYEAGKEIFPLELGMVEAFGKTEEGKKTKEFGGKVVKYLTTPPEYPKYSEYQGVGGAIEGGFETFKYYGLKPFSEGKKLVYATGEAIEQISTTDNRLTQTLSALGVGINVPYAYQEQVTRGTIYGIGALTKGVSTVLPETFADLGMWYVFPKVYKVAPTLIGSYVGYTGTKTALNKELSEEERVGGAIIGALGFTGAFMEVGGKGLNVWETKGKKNLPLASYDTKPFWKPSIGKKVYMKRYKGVDIMEPSTWLQSFKYKKGQFIQRQYKLMPAEVQARIEGLNEVTYYDVTKSNKVIKITKPTEPFPFDKPSKHAEWFKKYGKEEFGLINQAEIIKLMGGEYAGFGYSATGQVIKGTGIYPTGQYYSGKGISPYFLRMGGESGYSSPLDFFTFSMKRPRVYAGYFKKVVENPAIREIRVKLEGTKKPVKMYLYKNPIKKGELQISLKKQEVEGQVFGERIPLRKNFYFKFKGYRIPIIEETFVEGLTPKQFAKLGGKKAIISEPSYSSLYADIRYPKVPPKFKYEPYKVSSKTISKLSYSPPSSKVSKISKVSSYQSRVSSAISKMSSSSYKPSKVSSYLSSVSAVSKPLYTRSYKPSETISRITTTTRIVPPPKYLTYGGYREKKSEQKGISKQIRKYQASVGAYSLGLYAPTKKIKGMKISGLELRPMQYANENYASNNYAKKINKVLTL